MDRRSSDQYPSLVVEVDQQGGESSSCDEQGTKLLQWNERVSLSAYRESLSDNYILLLILRFRHLEMVESTCFKFLRVRRCVVTVVVVALRVFSFIVVTPRNCP
jgi:hypothetical protein